MWRINPREDLSWLLLSPRVNGTSLCLHCHVQILFQYTTWKNNLDLSAWRDFFYPSPVNKILLYIHASSKLFCCSSPLKAGRNFAQVVSHTSCPIWGLQGAAGVPRCAGAAARLSGSAAGGKVARVRSYQRGKETRSPAKAPSRGAEQRPHVQRLPRDCPVLHTGSGHRLA